MQSALSWLSGRQELKACHIFASPHGTDRVQLSFLYLHIGVFSPRKSGGHIMGRGLLLWMLGIPLPIVILLVLFLR
jgi:hypothetical protein